jgi:hypothetical protein
VTHFYHIINPYKAQENTESAKIQARTLESLSNAAEFSKGIVKVEYIVRTDPKEGDFKSILDRLPKYTYAPLKLYSSDVGDFTVTRRLPILSDMFTVDITHEKDSYVIYTNMDICVSPFFYTECARLLGNGTECMVINRRTVDKRFIDMSLQEGFLSEGIDHPGHDCFVFPSAFLKNAKLPDSILGIGYVFRPLLLNCILNFKDKFKEFGNFYLTMHFGDDMEWKNPKYEDYLEHNKNQLIKIWRQFSDLISTETANPYVADMINKHFPFAFLK